MKSQLLVRIDKELKRKFSALSQLENKSVSEKVRELVEEYVREHDMETSLRDLWEKIGAEMKDKGYKEKDIKTIIKEVRSGK
jgi:predicted DNA-binding protein